MLNNVVVILSQACKYMHYTTASSACIFTLSLSAVNQTWMLARPLRVLASKGAFLIYPQRHFFSVFQE